MGLFDFLRSSSYKEGLRGVDKTGKPVVYTKGKWVISTSRKRPNTSKTSEASSKLEDTMYLKILYRLRLRKNKGGDNTWKYAIPYIPSKEIKISGTSKYNGMKVSTNALDSIAKYTKMTNTPIQTGLGLYFLETAKGNHTYFNFEKINKNDSEKTKQRKRKFNRELGNTEYAKNFGIIPAENAVNDHEYTDGGYNGGKPITDRPPLQHAFEHFNKGRYNPGDPNHTRDVLNAGTDIWKSPEIQNWWKTTLYRKFGGKIENPSLT